MSSKSKRGAKKGPASAVATAPLSQQKLQDSKVDQCLHAILAHLSNESAPVSGSPKEWEEFVRLHSLVDALREAELSVISKDVASSDDVDWNAKFDKFRAWLASNGLPAHALEFARFGHEGNGVMAARDVKQGENIVNVPLSLMLTTETAAKSELANLIQVDKLLQGIPSVTLAVHLLLETKKKEASKWAPYIDILPRSFGIPLFFSIAELEQLKGSPVRLEAMRFYWNVVRQYSHVRPLLTKGIGGKTPLLDARSVSFDDYAWAVASVVTRQNRIPVGGTNDNPTFGLALIPVWDMCNHTAAGEITTVFNAGTSSLECTAIKDFNKGEQVFIFYGPRPNSELLMCSGFVAPTNPHDGLSVRVGLPKDDPLAERRQRLLQRMNMTALCDFILRPSGICPQSLACFLRAFTATEPELSATESLRVGTLGDMSAAISPDNEQKCIDLLIGRCTLLLRAYPTSAEDDERLLSNGGISTNIRAAIDLRLCEKRILRATLEWLNKLKAGLAH